MHIGTRRSNFSWLMLRWVQGVPSVLETRSGYSDPTPAGVGLGAYLKLSLPSWTAAIWLVYASHGCGLDVHPMLRFSLQDERHVVNDLGNIGTSWETLNVGHGGK